MRWLGKGPFNIQIRPESHQEYPFPALRNAIVGGIQHSVHQPILQIQGATMSMTALKASQMIGPIFV